MPLLPKIVSDMVELGCSIIPVKANKKPCITTWKRHIDEAPTIEMIQMWAKLRDRTAWAMIAGKVSGRVILDFDGPEAIAYLHSWGKPHIKTLNGFHLHVKYPGFKVSTFNSKMLRDCPPSMRGIDVRGDGGYALFQGKAEGGRVYELLRPLDELVEVSDLPAELAAYAGLDAEREAPPARPAKNAPAKVTPITGSLRRVSQDWLLDQALQRAAGGRNNAGFWLAQQLRDNHYSEGEAWSVMLTFCSRVPDRNAKGERYTQSEALASLKSAFQAPPREALFIPRSDRQGEARDRPVMQAPQGEAQPRPPEETADGQPATLETPDGGKRSPNSVALDIVDKNGFLSSHQDAELWRHNGVYWRRSSTPELQAEAVYQDGVVVTTSRRRNEIASMVRALSFVPRIEWNYGLKRSEIPFENGVLNLATGELRSHTRGDFLDWAVPHEYDGAAQCPLWLQTLKELFLDDPDTGDADDDEARITAAAQEGRDRIALLQEYAGYCLMSTRPRFALIVKGKPDSGKSILLNVIRAVVGEDWCCNVGWEDVSDPRKLAPIANSQLNAIPEASERGYISDKGFNALLGTDKLMIDPKFIAPYMVQPRARHIMLCNELPEIKNQSGAVYKRLQVIEMPRTLSQSEQDENREAELLQEIGGITAWTVEGARRLWRHKLKFTSPKASRAMLREYRTEQNPMHEFIDAYCTIDSDLVCPREALFNAYRHWAQRPNLLDSEMRRMLRGAGFQISKQPVYFKQWGKNVQVVKGITLSAGIPNPTFMNDK